MESESVRFNKKNIAHKKKIIIQIGDFPFDGVALSFVQVNLLILFHSSCILRFFCYGNESVC